MSKPTIRATLTKPPVNGEAQQPRTPLSGAGSLVASGGGILREAIAVRTYFSERGNGMQPVRACVWVKPATPGANWLSGRGAAGECGYHKESEAIAQAVRACGVQLWGTPFGHGPSDLKKPFDFGNTGSIVYEEVFRAIARAVGYRGRTVWVSHGL